jgi:hypothetical protein
MPAAPAQAFDLDDLPPRGKARLGGGLLQELVEARAFDLVGSPATLADQQNAMMGVAEVLAGGVGVAAFDLVQKAVVEKELQRAVDGRGSDRLVLLARQFLDDRIGPQGSGRIGEDRQDLAAQRGELQALLETGLLDLRRPVRLLIVVNIRVHRHSPRTRLQ